MAKGGIQILVFLLFCQKTISGTTVETKTLTDGESVNIQCKTGGAMVFWFRVVDNIGIEFIASFRNSPNPNTDTDMVKSSSTFTSIFSKKKMSEKILELTSFNKERDSGLYGCASLNNNMLNFGKVTRLVGPDPPKPTPTTTTATSTNLIEATTIAACLCNTKQVKTSPYMLCDPIMLGPLAGACGLLLLLLVTTICYCNRIRTRRCPHHNKRQPRMKAPGKQQAKANRHV